MPNMSENHWLFGRFGHIEFPGGGAPISHPPSSLQSNEGCASISDPDTGELLFYVNGYNLWDGNHNLVATGLEGHSTSTQTVLILPPPAGGSLYHVIHTSLFGGFDIPFIWATESPITHSAYSVSGSGSTLSVQQVVAPTPMFGGVDHNERLTSVTNADGTGYWVIAQQANSTVFNVLSIVTDTPVELPAQSPGAPQQTSIGEVGYMRVTPDAKTLAYCDQISDEIVFCDFDNSTGQINYRCNISGTSRCYGLEFSRDSQLVYYSFDSIEQNPNGTPVPNLFQAPMPQQDALHSNSVVLHQETNAQEILGALQMAPDNKIYIIRNQQPNLSVIPNPEVPGVGCGFVEIALDASGAPLTFSEMGILGLPNFVQRADPKTPICEDFSNAINDTIKERFETHRERLKPCEEVEEQKWCAPVELPKFNPNVNVIWKHRECGGIAQNSCAIMLLTISNPYSNLTFSDVMVHSVIVVDADGQPVPVNGDGQPLLEIVPIGPYCFGDIGPCDYIAREFTVHGRGIDPGDYKILVDGICFDICLHQDTQVRCFHRLKLHLDLCHAGSKIRVAIKRL